MSQPFIGMSMELTDHTARFVRIYEKAQDRATAKLVKMIERSMKKLTPYRHGTNQRSIFSKSEGSSGFVTANSGYSWWLEILRRSYEHGKRLYMAESYSNNKDKYTGLIRTEFRKLAKF